MTLWLVRAGKHGEYEDRFLEEKRIFLTWNGLNRDLRPLKDWSALTDVLNAHYPDMKPKGILNWASQIWPFAHEMKAGELVVLPLKREPAIQIGEITGDYTFHPDGTDPYYHSRTVKWVGEQVPRQHFGQDLLYSFGAFMTICRIKRNNAEKRLQAMRANGFAAEKLVDSIATNDDIAVEGDLETLAHDQIANLIMARFKGHDLTRLVEGILQAKGYTTWSSPPGADGGADILAGAPPLGFGRPRLCVEVKSESTPIDRPTVDKLLGAVTKFGADEGLFVSWSGFKTNVRKELASSFFRVRLWSRNDLLEALFEVYDDLDESLRAELPLKRTWTVATQGGES